MKPKLWRHLIAIIAAVLLCDSLAAAPRTDDLTSVIVVLRPLPRGEAAFDPAAFGGVIEHRSAFQMIVRVPEDSIDEIRGHKGVRSVQRAGTGFPDRRAVSRSTTRSRTYEVGTQTNDFFTTGAYTYNGLGSITAIGPNQDNATDQYQYDSLDRIASTTVHAGATAYTQSFQYDQYGNLISRTTGSTTVSTPAESTTNRLASSTGAQYDASGSMTRDLLGRLYQYDAAGMATARTGQKVYLYTADDERIATINLGDNKWHWTLRDLSQKVVREYESTGTGTAQSSFLWLEDHYYANGRLLAADLDSAEGARRHFHLDHLGTARVVTNGSGQRISSHTYYPFGAEATSISQERDRGYNREEPLRFTGHERDGLEESTDQYSMYLDYMHARYYSPHWGRFLTVDPSWKSGDLTRSQSWNRYAYVENNPVLDVDPDGEAPQAAIGAAIGAGVGLVVGGYKEIKRGYSEPVTWTGSTRRILGAVAGGAASGALSTVCPTCNIGIKVGIGANASVIGGVANRLIAGEEQTVEAARIDAIAGAAGMVAGEAIGAAAKAASSNAVSRNVIKDAYTRQALQRRNHGHLRTRDSAAQKTRELQAKLNAGTTAGGEAVQVKTAKALEDEKKNRRH